MLHLTAKFEFFQRKRENFSEISTNCARFDIGPYEKPDESEKVKCTRKKLTYDFVFITDVLPNDR